MSPMRSFRLVVIVAVLFQAGAAHAAEGARVIEQVPEPTTLALLGMASAIAFIRARKKKGED
jgi:hypothetical protein